WRIRSTSRTRFASPSGSPSGAIVPSGMSRAEPLTITPQPVAVPTIVNVAAPGSAQPLAQPETCTERAPSNNGAALFAIAGPSARVAILPEAQIGAPAQAATRLRGSSA